MANMPWDSFGVRSRSSDKVRGERPVAEEFAGQHEPKVTRT